MRHLVSSDIPDIALGSSLLGAGGGGDPYVGGLIARQALDKAGSVELYDADEVPDEWLVATIGEWALPVYWRKKASTAVKSPTCSLRRKNSWGASSTRSFCPRSVA